MLILRCICDRVLRERTVGPNHRCEVFERPDALMPLIRSVWESQHASMLSDWRIMQTMHDEASESLPERT